MGGFAGLAGATGIETQQNGVADFGVFVFDAQADVEDIAGVFVTENGGVIGHGDEALLPDEVLEKCVSNVNRILMVRGK